MYYIYIWYVINTGEVFYVGRGHGNRYKTLKKRSEYFHQFYDNYQCESKIIENDLIEEESYKKEKEWIAYYKAKGEAKANIHNGGKFGGDVVTNLPKDKKDAFVTKMTLINKERCNTENFRKKIKEATIQRYKKHPEIKQKQSIQMKQIWTEEKRKEHSKLTKEYYKNNPGVIEKRAKKMYKPCVLEINGNVIHFDSLKDLKKYLQDNLDIKSISRAKEQDMLHNKVPFTTTIKKFKKYEGFKMYYVV